jgi:hypothetical protein
MQIPTNAMGIMFVRIDKGESARDNMGDWLVQQRIAQSISVVTEVVHKYSGIVGKTFESAILSTFPKADRAAKAACEIQRALFADNSESTVTRTPMEIRISLNYGRMMVAAGNVAGPEIDIVVELCGKAEADQVVATAAFFNALSNDEKKISRAIGKFKTDSMKSEIDLYEIDWTKAETKSTPKKEARPTPAPKPAPVAKPEPELSAVEEEILDQTEAIEIVASEPASSSGSASTTSSGKSSSGKSTLEVTYKHQQFTLNTDKPTLSIGRKIENDIVIDQAYVSRNHASIELREEGFVLKNMGANGSRVFIGQSQLGERCREEMALSGSGKITLGPPLDEAVDEIIYFKQG